jgi:hypothetical protein
VLLAEIHGKRLPAAEEQEDWLTSAVFGHLRLVSPPLFWEQLFNRAMSASAIKRSLVSEMNQRGILFERYSELETRFWTCFPKYGEPDLLLRFTGVGIPPLTVVIEVKLNSGKSGVGSNDQLVRYLQLLRNKEQIPEWNVEDHRVLVYLTRSFAQNEMNESLALAPDDDSNLFGLEWRDILETAQAFAAKNQLLHEVYRFLRGRGFEAFHGFRELSLPSPLPGGRFYGYKYFQSGAHSLAAYGSTPGRFYER